jgi:acetyl-CoA carboxylase biotin carboxylase subunit
MRGHALECRVYAEDPATNFLPSPGTLQYVRAPGGPGVRDDSSVYSGCEITSFYDPMLSKLVVWGDSREDAVDRMFSALREYVVLGVKTNLGFLIRMMQNSEFRKAQIDTGFIERHPELLVPEQSDPELILMAAAVAMNGGSNQIVQGTNGTSSGWKLFARRAGVSGNPLL